MYRKDRLDARAFVKAIPGEDWVLMAKSPRMLLHTRATTKGSEKNNENNHPVIGFGWVVVHNGSVTNDDDLWDYYHEKQQVERFAEVDTSAVPLVLSREAGSLEASLKQLTLLGGNATLGIWGLDYPETIVLARFGFNDLILFYDNATNILYWSSASSATQVIPGPLFGNHKFLTFSKLAEDHAMVLRPNREEVRVFKFTRRPFFQRRIVSPPTTQPTKATELSNNKVAEYPRLVTGVSITIPRKDALAHGAVATQVQWRATTLTSAKPSPKEDVLGGRWWKLAEDVASMLASPAVLVWPRPAGYGRWEFERTGETLIRRVFRPYGRTRKWWRRLFPDKVVQLPAALQENGTIDMDNRLPWEHYDVTVEYRQGRNMVVDGAMCPWCGIWEGVHAIRSNNWRCMYCNVRSLSLLTQGRNHDSR